MTRQLTAEILAAAVEGFEARKLRIDEQIAQVRQLMDGDRPVAATTPEPQKRPRRKMTAAARKRIGDAQRKRWAAKGGAKTAPKATAKPKRKLSDAGRAAIVVALKKLWAAKKAGLTVVQKAVPRKSVRRKAAASKAAANGMAAA